MTLEKMTLNQSSTPNLLEPKDPAVRLLDIAILFGKRWRLILGSAIALGATGLGISCISKPVFTATAMIMAPESASSSSNLLLGALATSSIASGLGKNPSDLYLGILKGNTVTDDVIHQFHLDERYHTHYIEAARKVVAGHSKLLADKSSLITISYTDKDPQLAAAVANGFVSALYRVQAHMATAEASQRRAFYLQQMNEEQDALDDAEKAFVKEQKSSGIFTLSGQLESVLRSIAETKESLASQEVELQTLRLSATEDNPQVQQLEASIKAHQAQLAILEEQQAKSSSGGLNYSLGQMPDASLGYTRSSRQVQYHQILLQALVRQFETAKLDESRSAPMIQVVDTALVPEHKSGPSRLLYTIAGGFIGLLLAAFWTLVAGIYAKLKKDPDSAQKLRELKGALVTR